MRSPAALSLAPVALAAASATAQVTPRLVSRDVQLFSFHLHHCAAASQPRAIKLAGLPSFTTHLREWAAETRVGTFDSSVQHLRAQAAWIGGAACGSRGRQSPHDFAGCCRAQQPELVDAMLPWSKPLPVEWPDQRTDMRSGDCTSLWAAMSARGVHERHLHRTVGLVLCGKCLTICGGNGGASSTNSRPAAGSVIVDKSASRSKTCGAVL
jgi:hypothetical protein